MPAVRPRLDQSAAVERGPDGALLVGSPQEAIDKLLYQHELFGHQRVLVQLSVGTMPHDKIMRSIELYGTEVAPVVRRETGAPISVAPSPTL